MIDCELVGVGLVVDKPLAPRVIGCAFVVGTVDTVMENFVNNGFNYDLKYIIVD